LGAVNPALFETGLNLLAGLFPDSAQDFADPAASILRDTGRTKDIDRRNEIASLQRLLGLRDGVFGVQADGVKFLPEQCGLGVVRTGPFQDLPADGVPAVGDSLPGLRDPDGPLLMTMLPLDNRPAYGLSQLRHIGGVARQLLGLVAVGQRRIQSAAGQGLTTPLHIGPCKPTEKSLTVPMTPDVIGPGDLEGLVEPPVGQRTLRLFDTQDQHDKAPSRCERRRRGA